MALTNDEWERLRAASLAKAKTLPISGYDGDGWLLTIIGTVIADTSLVIDGTLTPELTPKPPPQTITLEPAVSASDAASLP